MKTSTFLMTLLMASLFFWVVSLSTGVTAYAMGRESVEKLEKEIHCTIQIEPVHDDTLVSKMSNYRCFDSFTDVLEHLSDGNISVPTNFSAKNFASALMPASSSSTVIGIDFQHKNFGGSTLTWYTSESQGCLNGATFVGNTMPTGWDNKVSSVRAYQGCDNFNHYEDIYLGGAVLTCPCSQMNAMNDETSSVRFTQ